MSNEVANDDGNSRAEHTHNISGSVRCLFGVAGFPARIKCVSHHLVPSFLSPPHHAPSQLPGGVFFPSSSLPTLCSGLCTHVVFLVLFGSSPHALIMFPSVSPRPCLIFPVLVVASLCLRVPLYLLSPSQLLYSLSLFFSILLIYLPLSLSLCLPLPTTTILPLYLVHLSLSLRLPIFLTVPL